MLDKVILLKMDLIGGFPIARVHFPGEGKIPRQGPCGFDDRLPAHHIHKRLLSPANAPLRREAV